MRGTFFNLLHERMESDERLFFLAADMGLGLIEPFEQDFPDRTLNVGIAEANMVGIAAGLCNLGYRPVCYTISNFLVQRAFEQIRNDICLHGYPVVFVGTSTGYDNGKLGPTHQVIDDIGTMKILPQMRIYSPSTVCSIPHIFEDILRTEMPAYVRIGKGSYRYDTRMQEVNGMIHYAPQNRTLVITHGTTLDFCMAALKEVPFSLYVVNRINPLEPEEWRSLLSEYTHVLVVEDHVRESGLYGSMCRLLQQIGRQHIPLMSLSPTWGYDAGVGDRDYFARRYGYDTTGVVQAVQRMTAPRSNAGITVRTLHGGTDRSSDVECHLKK